jgi:hypothetical protein
MPIRGSLKQCIRHAVETFKSGYSDTVVITGNRAAKYYTLFLRTEFDATLALKPHWKTRVVLCCTGGELASIIDITRQQLQLFSEDDIKEIGHTPPPEQTTILKETNHDANPEALDKREQPRTDPA